MERSKYSQVLLNEIYGLAFAGYTFFSILIYFSYFYVHYPVAAMAYKVFQYLVIFLLLAIVLLRGYSGKKIWGIMVCILLSGYAYFLNHEVRILVFVLFAFASRYVEPQKVLKLDFGFRIISFCLVLFFCVTHVLPNITLARAGGGIRYALGFSHPNYG